MTYNTTMDEHKRNASEYALVGTRQERVRQFLESDRTLFFSDHLSPMGSGHACNDRAPSDRSVP